MQSFFLLKKGKFISSNQSNTIVYYHSITLRFGVLIEDPHTHYITYPIRIFLDSSTREESLKSTNRWISIKKYKKHVLTTTRHHKKLHNSTQTTLSSLGRIALSSFRLTSHGLFPAMQYAMFTIPFPIYAYFQLDIFSVPRYLLT